MAAKLETRWWLWWAIAALVQLIAVAGVVKLRGDFTAYAYQSPDCAEYVALARGLAWHGTYVPYDSDNTPQGRPDTWRTPGFPLFMAPFIRLAGDSTRMLLVLQQLLAIAAVPLMWAILRRVTTSRLAALGTLCWCIDPFRLYHSFWLMAETLFVLVLLVGIWLWIDTAIRGWSRARILILATVAALLVLIRPIGLPLPLLVIAGVIWQHRRAGLSRLTARTTIAVAAVAIVLFPWVLRNRMVGGHWAISHQSGASFTYHKVVDILLCAEGKSSHRFDYATLDARRGQFDRQLQQQWAQRFGPLTEEQEADLHWQRLNYGRTRHIDPFVASSMLWSIGLEQLRQHPWATIGCSAWQGAGMLIFPLNLVIWPPVTAESVPMAQLLGTGPSRLRTAIAIALGLAHGTLAAVAIGRALWLTLTGPSGGRLASREAQHRSREPNPQARPPCASTAPQWAIAALFWPAAALWLLAVPFEDPRFRLPLVPMMWVIALYHHSRPKMPPTSSPSLPGLQTG